MSFFCTEHGFAVFLNTKFTKIKKRHFSPILALQLRALSITLEFTFKNMHKTHLKKTFSSKITCRTMRCDPTLWYFVNFHFSYA